jgi:hypothetical protein
VITFNVGSQLASSYQQLEPLFTFSNLPPSIVVIGLQEVITTLGCVFGNFLSGAK